MYFCNHTGFGDFFIDTCITNGGAYLGRLAVFFAVPFSCILNHIDKGIIFFRRTRSTKEQLNAQLDRQQVAKPDTGLLIYPQGTRKSNWRDSDLKTGMMRYAFRRGMPCQVVISTNKEHVMKEKGGLYGNIGVQVDVVYGDAFYPSDFNNEEDWIEEVKRRWLISMETAIKTEEYPDPELPVIECPRYFFGVKVIGSFLCLLAFLILLFLFPLHSSGFIVFLVLFFAIKIIIDTYRTHGLKIEHVE